MQDYDAVYTMVMERQARLRSEAAERRLLRGSLRIELRLPRFWPLIKGGTAVGDDQETGSSSREAA